MENTKEIKTINQLFDCLEQSMNADCKIGTYQYETYFTIYIVTIESVHEYKIEHFENKKGVKMFLYDCMYYTEEDLISTLLQEMKKEIEKKIENLLQIQNKLLSL